MRESIENIPFELVNKSVLTDQKSESHVLEVAKEGFKLFADREANYLAVKIEITKLTNRVEEMLIHVTHSDKYFFESFALSLDSEGRLLSIERK